ncbi:MAG TPA: ATP-binding protein [Streptosporangiaceae bacterium]|nr:ATP-binding protein [Streptosporangiaceae bacterium]
MRVFPATPAQVREARQFLAAILDGRSAADDAVLCLCELVTNAVLYSRSGEPGGHFTVRAQLHDNVLRVEVRDDGGPWIWPAYPDGQHGRGLHIVAQLARACGRTGDATAGWSVWFKIDCPLPPRTPAAVSHRSLRQRETGDDG